MFHGKHFVLKRSKKYKIIVSRETYLLIIYFFIFVIKY